MFVQFLSQEAMFDACPSPSPYLITNQAGMHVRMLLYQTGFDGCLLRHIVTVYSVPISLILLYLSNWWWTGG